MSVVTRILPRTPIASAVTRAPWALVRVDKAERPVFHRGLVDFFDRRFPERFTFAVLRRPDFAPDALALAFQTPLGRLRRGVVDGYYLFDAGLVVGHHLGETRPPSVRYASDEAEFADDPVVTELAAASPLEAAALRELAAYFLPIVLRRDGGPAPGPGRPPPPPPPPPPRRPEPSRSGHDAYEVLGIPTNATDDEVKAAFRRQLKLNHPDKVAHLSSALQKFAEAETLRIKHAYETILALRVPPSGRRR